MRTVWLLYLICICILFIIIIKMVKGGYIHSRVLDPNRSYNAYCSGCRCKHYSPFFRNITKSNIGEFKSCLPYFANYLKVINISIPLLLILSLPSHTSFFLTHLFTLISSIIPLFIQFAFSLPCIGQWEVVLSVF